VRWNTVSRPAVFATSWIVCTPVAPVPITATRLPSKLTGSCGQRAVWQDWPWKLSTPSITGIVGADSGPIAVIMKRALNRLPSSSVTSQFRVASCQCAAATRLRNRMSRRRSNLSATWFR
jgi:hypothetical protein